MGIKGSEIVQRIDERRVSLGLSRKDVALSAGLKSVQSITDWNNGSIPQADTALCMADKLKVSVRWLLTGDDDLAYTQDEQNLVIKYRCLDDQGQYEIKTLMDAKLSVRKENIPNIQTNLEKKEA
jgi:transcriptional regulator with XRE-family HTH domain